MKSILPIISFQFFFFLGFAQTNTMHFNTSKSLNDSIIKIMHEVHLDGHFYVGENDSQQVSFAVIDLSGKKPVLAGFNEESFIYPASVYKMYVAMEILKQVSENKYSLYRQYIVPSPNDIDHVKEIENDPRPLLRAGDTVTVNYLLDLMITRSDNSAANCLIDIAGRKNINETMHHFGWYGSEVTRKFLPRKFEDPGFDTVRGTQTCALHAAEFMYKIYSNQLINPWVSMQLKALLGRQLDVSKLSTGLPDNFMFYHKTGWWSYYTHDVGIVDNGKIKYIIALFTPIKQEEVLNTMKILSEKINKLMINRHT
ncbi:MAG: serine hydrolase [Bacteroidetes bacterium]|nr:serine hydrolase [Bacteroidota bacterium]MBS1756804.1 serine hydrolase [Bacteroidota bacterium]